MLLSVSASVTAWAATEQDLGHARDRRNIPHRAISRRRSRSRIQVEAFRVNVNIISAHCWTFAVLCAQRNLLPSWWHWRLPSVYADERKPSASRLSDMISTTMWLLLGLATLVPTRAFDQWTFAMWALLSVSFPACSNRLSWLVTSRIDCAECMLSCRDWNPSSCAAGDCVVDSM